MSESWVSLRCTQQPTQFLLSEVGHPGHNLYKMTYHPEEASLQREDT